jgi:hypothetical protein
VTQPITVQGTDLEVILLAGCSLDEKPGKNWVEEAGGLPNYICRIARAIKRTGKTTSQAIAIAVSRVKVWAAGGGGVNADTRAKAAKAVAQWEALKAKSKGRQAVKATSPMGEGYLMLCGDDGVTSFNVEVVRRAFEDRQRRIRDVAYKARGSMGLSDESAPVLDDYRYIKELWTDFIVVEGEGRGGRLAKIPYTVSKDLTVTFGPEVEVVQEYVEVPDSDDEALTDDEREALAEILGM